MFQKYQMKRPLPYRGDGLFHALFILASYSFQPALLKLPQIMPHALWQPVLKRNRKMRMKWPVPFAWYALITVFVPLLNGAARLNGSRFAEHAALVITAWLCVFIIPVAVTAILKKRVDILNQTKEKSEKG